MVIMVRPQTLLGLMAFFTSVSPSSGNVHTTRKLAYELGMNYAWGLEFVELTRGDREEQNATQGMNNSLGLHGNAILSNCKLYDPIVIRDKLPSIYFSNKVSWENADGYEKRLGACFESFWSHS